MGRRQKAAERRVASERVTRLLAAAHEEAHGPDKDLAHRYTALARRIAMRYQMPLPSEAKERICRRCTHHVMPGMNQRVRLRRGRRVVTCLDCGHVRRRPL